MSVWISAPVNSIAEALLDTGAWISVVNYFQSTVMIMTRLLNRLKLDLSEARDEEGRTVAEMRIGIYLARTGNLIAAQEFIEGARKRVVVLASAKVYGWLNIAESVLAFFGDDHKLAIEKIRRAEAICQAIQRDSSILALARSWRAHYEALSDNWKEATKLIQSILTSESPPELEAMTRVAMVVGNSSLEMNDVTGSEKWYEVARKCALGIGDSASVEAIIFNRAAFRVQNLRLTRVERELAQSELALCSTEVSSASNYCSHTGIKSIYWMLELLRGQIAFLGGDYVEAQVRLRSELLGDLSVIREPLDVERRLDLAICAAKCDNHHPSCEEIQYFIDAAETAPLDSDRATFSFSLHLYYSWAGDVGNASKYLRQARESLARYRKYQEDIRELLREISLPTDLHRHTMTP